MSAWVPFITATIFPRICGVTSFVQRSALRIHPTHSWRDWLKCFARFAVCCAMTARCSSILETLIFLEALGVQALVALPAKHLKVVQRVIVFAEVFVMRVNGLIA